MTGKPLTLFDFHEAFKQDPLGWPETWTTEAANGKPVLRGGRRGTIAHGTLGTWVEFELIAALLNALPAIAADHPQPVESAPLNTPVLVWWPTVALDEDGDLTERVTGGAWVLSELQGSCWMEPDVLTAMGEWFGDGEEYGLAPTFWKPLPAPMNGDGVETCPICAGPLVADQACATDIEMGTCHAACLEGAPTVDLDTGEPIDGPIPTFPYEPDGKVTS